MFLFSKQGFSGLGRGKRHCLERVQAPDASLRRNGAACLLSSSPPPRSETGHLSALFKVALCLQDNVAKGSRADTTGNLPVSEEEAAPVAEAVRCHRCGVEHSCRVSDTQDGCFLSLPPSLLEAC